MDIKQIVLDLCALSDEQEWFEFKENWFQPEALGEYVSALSNAAAFHYKKYAYFIWGVNDTTHEIVGTTFNQYCEYNKEPYQNYLARNLSPSINFSFEETEIYGKRVVGLVIPAATEIPTAFKEKRFLRIGSSKCNMKDYPKREIELFKILDGRTETIETVPAKYQELTFQKLFGYYGSKGIVLNQKTFIKNLGLKTEEGEFNILAQLLSDNSHFPLRVSIFDGETKGSNLFSVREFGNDCLLYSLDELLRYGDVLNLIQADETDRVVERKEVPLFDNKAFREAVINAVLHNKWVEGNEPMISVFSDRIEKFIPPKKGRKHILYIIRELIDFKAESRRTDIRLGLEYLTNVMKRRCTAFLLSDFIDQGNFKNAMTIANRKHDMVAIQVYDRRVEELPAIGLMKIKDAETGHEQWIDTSSRAVRRAHHDWWVNKQVELNETFTKSNVDNVSVRTDQDYVKALMNLFAKRN